MPRDHVLRLITLGRLQLVQADGREDVELTRRRRKLAVLAVLALNRGPVSREVLLEMFWGDQSEPLARHSLSDALSHLRRALGRNAITMHRADVVLADDAPLRVDVGELVQAVARGEDERAVALYAGEFLGGISVGGSVRFEHWVDAKQAWARQLFVTACERRCATLLREGRAEECAALAARWLEETPLSADAGRALIHALALPGTGPALASARSAYDAVAGRLMREYAAPPDPSVTALADEVSARLTAVSVRAPLVVQSPDHGPQRTVSRGRQRRVALLAIPLAAVVVVLAIKAVDARRPTLPNDAAHATAIAVMPFRVRGADSSLVYLSEGMPDLLSMKLDGTTGPRAVDSRAVMSAWRHAGGSRATDVSTDAALDIGRRLGATRLLLGGVVGTASRLVLEVSIVAVRGGRVLARLEVQGPADSLSTLVDRVAAGVLASEAGESGPRLATLTRAPLPALRAYLAGREAYRSARMPEAIAQYRRALELDSTLAPASLGLAAAGAWTTSAESERAQRELTRAWRLHARLSERDRALFDAYVGPRFPGMRSAAYELAAWDRAAQISRDSPEVWYELGDRLFHVGAVLGIRDYQQQATAAFSSALALDSSFALPIAHLLELAAGNGDAAAVRRLLALYDERGAAGATADFVRWRAAVALADSGALRTLRARLRSVASASLERIVGTSQLDGVDLGTAVLAAEEMRARSATRPAKLLAYVALHDLALNRGRRDGTFAAIEGLRAIEPIPAGYVYSVRSADHLTVADALFGGGDTVAAFDAARVLRDRARRLRTPAQSASVRAEEVLDVCTLGLWDGLRGGRAGIDGALANLHAAAAPDDSARFFGADPTLCLAMLAAIRDADVRTTTPASLRTLDSVATSWPPIFGAEFANLVAARLWATHGDTLLALAAVRRRPYYWTLGPRYLATFLSEEVRFAASTGDRAGAARAAAHLATLRGAVQPVIAATDARRR